MKVNPFVCIITAIVLQMPAQLKSQTGSESLKFSLKEAQAYALDHSPVLLNSARDVEIAKMMIWETTSIGLPQANLSGTYNYAPKLAGLQNLFTGGDTTGGSGSPFGFEINPEDLKTTFFADVQVSQLIFSGQYIVGLQASKAYANLSKLADSKSKADLAENITNVYFSILINRSIKSTLDSTRSVVERTYKETEQLFKAGFAQSTDVDQLKIQLLNILSSLSTMDRSIEFTERVLKFQIGVPVDQPIELTDQISGLIHTMELETAIIDSLNISENLTYQIANTSEKLSMLNLRAKKALFLPTFGGYYNRHWDFDNNLFNDQSDNMFGLSLSFPLITSGQRIAQTGQAKLEYMKAKTEREMLSEQLIIQYETELSNYLAARDIFNMQRENRDLSYRIYMNSITRFREGMGSSLDMNQAQNQYFSAESNYYTALITLVTAKSNLENLLTQNVN